MRLTAALTAAVLLFLGSPAQAGVGADYSVTGDPLVTLATSRSAPELDIITFSIVSPRIALATIDISQLKGFAVRGFSGGKFCGEYAERVNCGVKANQRSIVVQVKVPPDVKAGIAGELIVSILPALDDDTNLANNEARVMIDMNSGEGSKVDVSIPETAGAIGETVVVAVSGQNAGPNTLATFNVGEVTIPGATFLGYENGCRRHTHYCGAGPILVGKAATVGVRLKIYGCAAQPGTVVTSHTIGITQPSEDVTHPFTLRVAGCDAPAKTTWPMPYWIAAVALGVLLLAIVISLIIWRRRIARVTSIR